MIYRVQKTSTAHCSWWASFALNNKRYVTNRHSPSRDRISRTALEPGKRIPMSFAMPQQKQRVHVTQTLPVKWQANLLPHADVDQRNNRISGKQLCKADHRQTIHDSVSQSSATNFLHLCPNINLYRQQLCCRFFSFSVYRLIFICCPLVCLRATGGTWYNFVLCHRIVQVSERI